MKISVLNVVMFAVGAILLYSGIKAYYPQDVIKWGLGGKKPEPFNKKPDQSIAPPWMNPDPGQQHPGDQFYGPPYEDDPDIPGRGDIIST